MVWDPWPLRHLVLRTPRLELRPDDDAGLFELAEEARLGVHPPEEMPFVTPWSDAPPDERGVSTLQWHWTTRAGLRPESWTVHFLVRYDGRVVGSQGLGADGFAVTREVQTGSWLGRRHQGRGIGTEMRAAVLSFAFDHLGAIRAVGRLRRQSRVPAHLGEARLPPGRHRDDRPTRAGDHGRPAARVEPATFRRPAWTLQVAGVDACLPVLGVTPG